MQHRIILNRNYNFQKWTGGSPDDWDLSGGSNFNTIQLDRHMPRNHPQRRVFPKHLKANDLVKDGDFALRLQDDGSGGGSFSVATTLVQVEPGQNLSTSLVYRYTLPVDNFSLNIKFFSDQGVTDIAEVKQPRRTYLNPDPANQVVLPGNESGYNLEQGVLGGSNIRLVVSGNTPGVNYWVRFGAPVIVPMQAETMQATALFEVDDVDVILDLDDFRIEALDSRVHAGG